MRHLFPIPHYTVLNNSPLTPPSKIAVTPTCHFDNSTREQDTKRYMKDPSCPTLPCPVLPSHHHHSRHVDSNPFLSPFLGVRESRESEYVLAFPSLLSPFLLFNAFLSLFPPHLDFLYLNSTHLPSPFLPTAPVLRKYISCYHAPLITGRMDGFMPCYL